MPKGFTEAEKERIRAAIIREGRRLFSQYGLKKTSIGEITNAVGISQGAFYLFFDAKEELYFTILEEEEAQIKEGLTQSIPTDKDGIKAFLKAAFEVAETNPFFRQITSDENMAGLLRKLPEAQLKDHFNSDYITLQPVLEEWRKSGLMTVDDPELIASLFRGIFLLSLHKKEIGEALYPKTIELLISLIVEGLCK